MKSTVVVTPCKNINNQNVIIDVLKVKTITFDTKMDVFKMQDKNTGEFRKSNLMGVSLYDDIIYIGGIKHRIIRMTTYKS